MEALAEVAAEMLECDPKDIVLADGVAAQHALCSEAYDLLVQCEAGLLSVTGTPEIPAKAGISGLEFYVGIPGSVGGGIRMNAGAYGSELKDVIESVDHYNGEGKIKSCARESLQFQYRNLLLPEGACVAGGVFVLDLDRLVTGRSVSDEAAHFMTNALREVAARLRSGQAR
mgnify:CR=1 FL=1